MRIISFPVYNFDLVWFASGVSGPNVDLQVFSADNQSFLDIYGFKLRKLAWVKPTDIFIIVPTPLVGGGTI